MILCNYRGIGAAGGAASGRVRCFRKVRKVRRRCFRCFRVDLAGAPPVRAAADRGRRGSAGPPVRKVRRSGPGRRLYVYKVNCNSYTIYFNTYKSLLSKANTKFGLCKSIYL